MSDLITTIKRMAELARLELPEAQLKIYASKAEAVLSYVEKLNELGVDDVDPTSHAICGEAGIGKSEPTPMRSDEVKAWPEYKEIRDSAPERDGPFIQVPKVIE